MHHTRATAMSQNTTCILLICDRRLVILLLCHQSKIGTVANRHSSCVHCRNKFDIRFSHTLEWLIIFYLSPLEGNSWIREELPSKCFCPRSGYIGDLDPMIITWSSHQCGHHLLKKIESLRQFLLEDSHNRGFQILPDLLLPKIRIMNYELL